jgi:hypothetical protein
LILAYWGLSENTKPVVFVVQRLPKLLRKVPAALSVRPFADLLCFAVPTQTALKVNAFGGRAERVYAADWLTFNACQKLLLIEHNHKLVGTHF